MATLRLAWRNLWRNPRRTLLTAAALGLGVLVMVASADYTEGLFARMIDTTANGRTGHAQLHAPGFRETREEERLLADADALVAKARALPAVEAAAARVLGSALLAIGDRSRSVQLFGVEPAAEARVGRWTTRLAEGRFLATAAAASATAGEVVLGVDLARRLDVARGARVVVTAADLSTGEARSELLQVVGLLRSGDGGLDEGTAIVRREVAARLLGVGAAAAQEVVLRLRDAEAAPGVGVVIADQAAVAAAVAGLAAPGVEVATWQEVQPMIAELLRMQDAWMGIFLGLIFFIIAFVIVGTMSMALLERTWEFGLLRALGTPPSRLFAMVAAEAGWLGLCGASAGALGGHALSHALAAVGIDFGSDVQMVVRFHEPIRPVPDLQGALAYAAIFVVLTVLVSGVAALRATRVPPGLALRQR